jgi:hypothetical protein
MDTKEAHKNPKVYLPKEAAEMARMSLSAWYDGCKRDLIPHLRVGRKILVPKKSYDAWLNGEHLLREGSHEQ